MPIIEPDFLGYEAILNQLHDSSIDLAPKTAYINSEAVRLGTMNRKEALARDFQTNLGLCCK